MVASRLRAGARTEAGAAHGAAGSMKKAAAKLTGKSAKRCCLVPSFACAAAAAAAVAVAAAAAVAAATADSKLRNLLLFAQSLDHFLNMIAI